MLLTMIIYNNIFYFYKTFYLSNMGVDTADVSLIPGSGRSLGGGNGNPLQDSCLENSMVRGAWWATVAKNQTRPSD